MMRKKKTRQQKPLHRLFSKLASLLHSTAHTQRVHCTLASLLHSTATHRACPLYTRITPTLDSNTQSMSTVHSHHSYTRQQHTACAPYTRITPTLDSNTQRVHCTLASLLHSTATHSVCTIHSHHSYTRQHTHSMSTVHSDRCCVLEFRKKTPWRFHPRTLNSQRLLGSCAERPQNEHRK